MIDTHAELRVGLQRATSFMRCQVGDPLRVQRQLVLRVGIGEERGVPLLAQLLLALLATLLARRSQLLLVLLDRRLARRAILRRPPSGCAAHCGLGGLAALVVDALLLGDRIDAAATSNVPTASGRP